MGQPTFDAQSAGDLSFSHTCSGHDRVLFVSIRQGANDGDTVTAVTYGGQSLSKVGAIQNPGENTNMAIWRLVNPPLGSNTVSVTMSGPFRYTRAISYKNCRQNNVPDASTSGQAFNNNNANVQITTVTPKCRLLVFIRTQNNTSIVNTGGYTNKTDNSDHGIWESDSLVNAGATTINYGQTGGGSSDGISAFVVGIAPNHGRGFAVLI